MKTSLVITAAIVVAVAPASYAMPPEVHEAQQKAEAAHQQAKAAHERALEAHQRAFEVVKEIRDTIVPGPIIKFVESFPPIAEPRRAVLQLAQVNPRAVGQHVGPDPQAIEEWANNVAVSTTHGALSSIFGEGGKASKRPIIVGGDVKSIATVEEDLNVMLRIFDKSLGGRDEKATAMGIDVFSIGSGSSGPRTFYLDGYGAMFLLKVKYPLLPAPQPEETRTNETTNTEWERARQELYGVKEARNPWREQAEPFDEQRVETLKTQLIDDLVNAANIRSVKSDESIVVVVLGGGRGVSGQEQYARAVAGMSGRGGGTVSVKSSRSENVGQTTMTLRAKKSDVDAFAKGKMKSEEFRKKVSVQVY